MMGSIDLRPYFFPPPPPLPTDIIPKQSSSSSSSSCSPLKVFMYDLPRRFNVGMMNHNYNSSALLTTLPPWPKSSGLRNQHSVEYWLMASLLYNNNNNYNNNNATNHNYMEALRVLDPDSADVFFVPFFSSLSFNTHGHKMTDPETQIDRQLQLDLLHFLRQSKYWLRSGGRDHVIPMTHPNAFRFLRDQLNASMLVVVDFGRYATTTSNLRKDIVSPYVHVVQSFFDDHAPDPFHSRPTLLFFRGNTVRKDGGLVRAKLVPILAGHHDVLYEQSSATTETIKASTKGMRSSKFCLNPAGDTPSSCRLFDAIISHCVPVIVSDKIELPFEDQVDYSQFSVFFSVKEALQPGYMIDQLRNISEDRWMEMWKRLKDIAHHYEFQYPPKKDDAVNMIWREIGGSLEDESLFVKLHQMLDWCDSNVGFKSVENLFSSESPFCTKQLEIKEIIIIYSMRWCDVHCLRFMVACRETLDWITSFQTSVVMLSPALLQTSCGFLLQELQMIWDEVGEDKFERDKVLLDLEQECLEIYRRKVDRANMSRARLHQELAQSEAEFTHLLLSLDERSLPGRPEKMSGTLREQLESITPALQEMRLQKQERLHQFQALQQQIQKISAEITGQSEYDNPSTNVKVNENDLSLKKLDEFKAELDRLHDDKIHRLRRVEKYIDAIHNLSATLGMESSILITKVHPTLNQLCGISKNISDGILDKLIGAVKSLEELKQQRLEKLHYLGKSLTNLWKIMDAPYEDRHKFSSVIRLISSSSAEVSDPGSLTLHKIQQTEAEVKRLDQLKASKMKELFFKKQSELEEICYKSHMEIPSQSQMGNIFDLVDSGEIDNAELLASMEEQIWQAKEEASSRKVIMEKVEKWMLARDEERWLEEYSTDHKRYSVSRGAHKNLRRAERARVIVNRIPGKINKSRLVGSLIAKTKSWEEETNKLFLYDEVPLLTMLEEYNLIIQEREDGKQKQREKKKVHNQAIHEQEHFSSSRPSTSCRRSSSEGFNQINRRLSLNISHLGSNSVNSARKMFILPNHASHVRDETASVVSTYSGPVTP
ncbi:hypothetical protein ACFE04_023729 [Oxalis oulophora]